MEQFFGSINLPLIAGIIFCVYAIRSAVNLPEKVVVFLPIIISVSISIVGHFLANNPFVFNEAFINAIASAYFYKIWKDTGAFNPFAKKNGGGNV